MEPDLIFVADTYKKIENLSSFSCPKAYYIQDPHISTKRYLDLGHVEEYDYVFITQKNFMEYFRINGCKNVTWLPYAFEPDIMLDRPFEDRDIDLCFCGTAYPGTDRETLIKMLEQNFALKRSRVYLRDMAAQLRRAKIGFNKSLAGDLNWRNFETMGAGALLVTDRIDNGMFDLFQDKIHLVTYRDPKELQEIIQYYLKHDEVREAIAQNGQKEVISKHTYLHRAAEIFRICLGMDLNHLVERRLLNIKKEIMAHQSM
jgi:spore maturation protein CgeB